VLAFLDLIHFSSDIIEFLMPVSIVLSASFNLIIATPFASGSAYRRTSAATFGIIHGLEFSSFFRMISDEGETFIT
jgi:hypothetical protein